MRELRTSPGAGLDPVSGRRAAPCCSEFFNKRKSIDRSMDGWRRRQTASSLLHERPTNHPPAPSDQNKRKEKQSKESLNKQKKSKTNKRKEKQTKEKHKANKRKQSKQSKEQNKQKKRKTNKKDKSKQKTKAKQKRKEKKRKRNGARQQQRGSRMHLLGGAMESQSHM